MAKYGVAVYGVDLYGESSTSVEGGSTALIVISSGGSGQATRQSGSTSIIEILTVGNGVGIPLYLTITISSDKIITLDKKLFALQNEKMLALINVHESLWRYGYYAQINALLPNGIIENKGLYDYGDLTFYVLFGDDDTILANDGTLRLQLSFVRYAPDGITLVAGKRSRIATKKVYPSISI